MHVDVEGRLTFKRVCVNEDLAEATELVNTSTKALENRFCDGITLSNVTCLNEGSNALNHGRWEITRNHREINLDTMSYSSGKHEKMQTYLHECLRVVAGPLIEVMTIREASNTREGRHSCQTVEISL